MGVDFVFPVLSPLIVLSCAGHMLEDTFFSLLALPQNREQTP
jgi:hypothetical protein